MKIAVIVQRYGENVVGGAETFARLLSEHLSKYWQIEVLTTCAEDHDTWRNVFKESIETINGIKVRRFKNDIRRGLLYKILKYYIFRFKKNKNIDLEKQIDYIKAQGPYSSDLIEYIERNKNEYNLLVFITYLYCPTIFGLMTVPEKAILIPTAHNEKEIYLDIFKIIFRIPRAIVYLTQEEKEFVERIFNNNQIENEVIGIGIDDIKGNTEDFIRKYNIGSKFVLYLGRIDKYKNCKTMIDFFIKYKSVTKDDLKLVLIGKNYINVPQHDDILYMGKLPYSDRINAIKTAYVTVHPSPNESFCLSAIESLAQGTPILVNRDCPTLKGHCLRSKAGVCYTNYQEFAEKLSVLVADDELRRKLGENGMKYTTDNYSWNKIEKKYFDFFRKISD